MIYQSRSSGHKETMDSRLTIYWAWYRYMRIWGIKGVYQGSGFNNQKDGGVIHWENSLGRGDRFFVREDGKFSCRRYEHELPMGHQKWSYPTGNPKHRSKAHRRNQDWRSKITGPSGSFLSLYNINLSLSPQPLRYYSIILSQFVFIKYLSLILLMLPK